LVRISTCRALFSPKVHFTSGKFSAFDDAISEPGPNLPVDGSENICCR